MVVSPRSGHVADRLRALRRQRQLLQADVAEAVGVSRPFLAGCEAGKERPGRETALALARFYGVSLDWLLTGEGPDGGVVSADTEQEARLLRAFREMPQEEAEHLLKMMLARVRR